MVFSYNKVGQLLSIEIKTAKRYITYFGGHIRNEFKATIITDIYGIDIASVRCNFKEFKELASYEEQCVLNRCMTLREIKNATKCDDNPRKETIE